MKKLRTALLWVAAVAVFLVVFEVASPTRLPQRDFADFLRDAHSDASIAQVRIEDDTLTVTTWDGDRYQVVGVLGPELVQTLAQNGVGFAYGSEPRPWRTPLLIGLPILLFLVLFLYFLRRAQGQTTNILSLRKSTVRLVADEDRCTFDDVGGCEDAKEQLRDVIDFLEHPERWKAAGVRLPRGVLLEGPPGCGKTLLARAVAGESKAHFYFISASEFVEMFVGVGAARVRDTFEKAAKDAPAVLFVDELDAIGRKRGSGIGSSHDEREQTLNQILVCMDGFQALDRVVVIAATNRADVLDPALLRPGRFDRRIEIPMLSRDQRRAVLAIHTRGKTLAPDVDLDALADRTADMTGAALESLVNEAGLLAVRRLRKGESEAAEIRARDFDDARVVHAGGPTRFDCLDALLVESTTQLAQPTGKARVRLTLVEGTLVEGEIAWADATHIKLRGEAAGEGVVVPKGQIKTLEALDGTEITADVVPDRFAARVPGTA